MRRLMTGSKTGFAVAITAAVVAAAAGASTGAAPSDCGTYSGRGCAPRSSRVDLGTPRFSHPTRITNPLFPISRLDSAVLLGRVDGVPFRSETTLLPGTAVVRWSGHRTRVRISQYIAFRGGRLEEVALDRYAQADDGSVWYLGEDVFDYRRGTISSTEGTWLAGREGPPAMIMPGRPRVGDVFRTENIPGVVFEEVTVRDVGRTVSGPRGALSGAIVGSELHLDGSRSGKVFAPGYGEFLTSDSGDVEALALAIPADALHRPVPAELRALSTSAIGILESIRAHDWEAVDATAGRLPVAWRAIAATAPPRIAKPLVAKLGGLRRATSRRNVAAASQLSLDINRLALDLELRHRSAVAVDVDRFQLWAQQLRIDASAHDMAGVTGDVAVLEWMRARVAPALSPDGLRALDEGLRDLRGAADDGDLAATADHAARLGAQLRRASRA